MAFEGGIFNYQCSSKECGHVFNAFRKNTETEFAPCPACGAVAQKKSSRSRDTLTFTEKLYSDGFYHEGIGEVVYSDEDLQAKCMANGFYSKHEGAVMNQKHERRLLAKRVSQRPRELVNKPKWSGRGVGLPEFESYEKSDEE